jgi:hypothetical protein
MCARFREFNVIDQNKDGNNLDEIKEVCKMRDTDPARGTSSLKRECGLVVVDGESENFETFKSLKLRFGSIPLSRNRMTDGIKWFVALASYLHPLPSPAFTFLS